MPSETRPCEICSQPIEAERLEAVPETRLCAEHARAIEKHGGEYTRTLSWEKTSKDGSLKKNYGGIDTHKKRNQNAIEKMREEWRSQDGGNQD
jgi:hypothetical protein